MSGLRLKPWRLSVILQGAGPPITVGSAGRTAGGGPSCNSLSAVVRSQSVASSIFMCDRQSLRTQVSDIHAVLLGHYGMWFLQKPSTLMLVSDCGCQFSVIAHIIRPRQVQPRAILAVQHSRRSVSRSTAVTDG
jgi:hypothetical protein